MTPGIDWRAESAAHTAVVMLLSGQMAKTSRRCWDGINTCVAGMKDGLRDTSCAAGGGREQVPAA